MFWNTKKKDKQKKSWAKPQSNVYENFEVAFRQEAEIHQRWQRIEDVALFLKRRYEQNPDVIEYIEIMSGAEKVFTEGEVKHWSSAQIREALIRARIEELSDKGRLSKNDAKTIYEAFRSINATVTQIDEVTKELLRKYADNPECCAFIVYLRDVYAAQARSAEKGEDIYAFKDRLISIRMDVVVAVTRGKVNVSELENIYKEFKEMLHKKSAK